MKAIGLEPLELSVSVSCRGSSVRGLEAEAALIADNVGSVESSGGLLARSANSFRLRAPTRVASFHYRVNLDALAQRRRDIDLAFRSGRSLLAPASSFLLYPLPLDVGTEVKLWVDLPAGASFSTGLEREGDHYRFQAHEIPVLTYSAFGVMATRRIAVEPGGAELELSILDGGLELELQELEPWAKRRAEAVAEFFRGFPSRQTTVIVLPIPRRRQVLFGKLLPESGPGIALLLGAQTTRESLEADWVLVHELVHLGVPSFYGEGKWFDEGLATYFEPIIRARAGLYDAESAWRDFAEEMPRAVRALNRDGLERTKGFLEVYWGGALFCLLADVAARRASGGKLGLEDGIRRWQAEGGHAWEVWSLARALETADRAYPTPVLVPLWKRYGQQPAPLDLDALFRSLGVLRTPSGVELSESAALAWVRHAIFESGPPQQRVQRSQSLPTFSSTTESTTKTTTRTTRSP